jgi:hypothetical protein
MHRREHVRLGEIYDKWITDQVGAPRELSSPKTTSCRIIDILREHINRLLLSVARVQPPAGSYRSICCRDEVVLRRAPGGG